MISEALRIGAGAALGALARCALLGVFIDQLWPILVINLFGSLLMGLLRPGAFLGAGVLGGFTTFSTFIALSLAQPPLPAAAYLGLSVLGCVGAWLLGDQARRTYLQSANRRRGQAEK
ncbi:fluoride efflux transporter family protein [Corynebacterium sp. A21]|uniref:fluoride efflux transporter family protein n=1 Tax=Corynebacterium sp. A21 TaxID=3457318 RepID=UPI003FD3416C